MRRIVLLVATLGAMVAGSGVASATTDPPADITRCPGIEGRPEGAPDLVDAVGEIVELGTSIRWTLRFAEPLGVPDAEGKPFRVDVLIVDPEVPTVSFAFYRGLNRLLRYDAVADPVLTTLLIPERGQSSFLAPVVDGRTMTIRIPGRALTADEDETGTSPGLGQLRWGVVVRDGAACDLLGAGRPSQRLLIVEGAPPPPTASAEPESGWSWRMLAAAVAVVIGTAVVLVLSRRRRASSTPRR